MFCDTAQYVQFGLSFDIKYFFHKDQSKTRSPRTNYLNIHPINDNNLYMYFKTHIGIKSSIKFKLNGLFWSLTKTTKQAKELEATLGPNSYTIMDMRAVILYGSWIRLSYLFMCYMTQYVNSKW